MIPEVIIKTNRICTLKCEIFWRVSNRFSKPIEYTSMFKIDNVFWAEGIYDAESFEKKILKALTQIKNDIDS